MTGGAAGVVGQVLVVLGVALVAVGALGLVRLPDVYNRANAVTKAAALGLVLVLVGVAVLVPGAEAVVVLLVAAALQLFTVPVAGYAVGVAARRSRAPLAPGTTPDELGLPQPGRSAGQPAGQSAGQPAEETDARG